MDNIGNTIEILELEEVKQCRKKIVEMVGQIEDLWILEQIHKFAVNMTEEGD